MNELKYDSDFTVRYATYQALGGTDPIRNFDSVYSIDLEILRLTEQGGSGLTPEQVRTIVEEYNYTTMAAVEAKGYLTEVPEGYATETYVDTKIGDINTALEAIIGA